MRRAFTVLATLAVASGALAIGTISGHVVNEFGQGLHEVRVYASQTGGETTKFDLTYYDGGFQISGLPAGEYTMFCSRGWYYRSRVWPGIQVYDGQVTNVELVLETDYCSRAFTGGLTGTEQGQAFRTEGTSIVEMSVKNAWISDYTLVLSIHEGGPNGPQIGPSRTLTYGTGSEHEARYISGEIPVIPGKLYFLKVREYLGNSFTVLDSADGDFYPYGNWFCNGIDWGRDGMAWISSDNDGTVVSYNYPLDGNGSLQTWSNEVGQTFVAKGSYVAGAMAKLTIGWGEWMGATFSIHAGGPEGPQIGPAKTFFETSDWEHAVCWAPGEVPVSPGMTYYLKIVRAAPDEGLNFYGTSNQYPGGCCYIGGVAYPGLDITGEILEYTDLPDILLTNIRVEEPQADSAVVRWTSSVPSTSQVEYWTSGDTYHRLTDVDTTQVINHEMTITGLVPGLTYYYKVKSYRENYDWAVSAERTYVHTLPTSGSIAGYVRDETGRPVAGATMSLSGLPQTATTDSSGYYELVSVPPGEQTVNCDALGFPITSQPATVAAGEQTQCDFALESLPNLLYNHGFETGTFANWTKGGDAENIYSGPWFGDIVASEGTYFFGNACHGGTKNGYVYQRIPAIPGEEYQASCMSAVFHGDNPPESAISRVGLDPAGGTNYQSTSIKWSSWDQQDADYTWEWRLLRTPRANATASYVTIFLEFRQSNASGWHINCFDDAAVWGPAPNKTVTASAAWPAGWNLIAVPLEPVAANAATVLDKVVLAGNNLNGALFQYVPGAGYEIYPGDFTSLHAGRGYWLKLTAAATEDVTGPRTGVVESIPLGLGWCIVGSPQDVAVPLSDVRITDGAQTLTVNNAAAEGWISSVLYFYEPGVGYGTLQTAGGDDDMLRPWRGYWLRTYVDGLHMLVPRE